MNGNTLSDDKFEEQTFDYIISNPPFGREWRNEQSAVEKEAKRGFAGRFGAGLPGVKDGQMLFLPDVYCQIEGLTNKMKKGLTLLILSHSLLNL